MYNNRCTCSSQCTIRRPCTTRPRPTIIRPCRSAWTLFSGAVGVAIMADAAGAASAWAPAGAARQVEKGAGHSVERLHHFREAAGQGSLLFFWRKSLIRLPLLAYRYLTVSVVASRHI